MRAWYSEAEYRYINSPEFLRSPEWLEVRQDAYLHWDKKCQRCGRTQAELMTGEFWCVDHVFARATHPHLALEKRNLQVLDSTCNKLKLNTYADYRSKWHPYRITWWRRLWRWAMQNKSQ